jgi:hypothetical protein
MAAKSVYEIGPSYRQLQDYRPHQCMLNSQYEFYEQCSVLTGDLECASFPSQAAINECSISPTPSLPLGSCWYLQKVGQKGRWYHLRRQPYGAHDCCHSKCMRPSTSTVDNRRKQVATLVTFFKTTTTGLRTLIPDIITTYKQDFVADSSS